MFKNARIVSRGTSAGYFDPSPVKRGDPAFVMSSSSLRAFLVCNSRWRDGYDSPDSKAKLFGSLVDCLLMTPDEFQNRYPVHPDTYKNDKGEVKPWNANGKACKEWLESCDEHQEPISRKTFNLIERAVANIKKDEIIAGWVEACDTQVWLEAVWQDKATGLEVPVRALVDFVPRQDSIYRNNLGDLKCIRTASLGAFKKQVYQLGWHFQAALYLDLFVEATKEDRQSYCFIGVENFEPFQAYRRLLSLDFIDFGRQAYIRALERYAKCLKSGVWPAYDDNKEAEAYGGWSLVEPESWMNYTEESDQMAYSHEQAMEEQDENAGVTP